MNGKNNMEKTLKSLTSFYRIMQLAYLLLGLFFGTWYGIIFGNWVATLIFANLMVLIFVIEAALEVNASMK